MGISVHIVVSWFIMINIQRWPIFNTDQYSTLTNIQVFSGVRVAQLLICLLLCMYDFSYFMLCYVYQTLTNIQHWPISYADQYSVLTKIKRWPISNIDQYPTLTKIQYWPNLNADQYPTLTNIQHWPISNVDQYSILTKIKRWPISNADQYPTLTNIKRIKRIINIHGWVVRKIRMNTIITH